MLDKGYIRPSVSPLGAPVLFVKKKESWYSQVVNCLQAAEQGDHQEHVFVIED